LKSDGWDGHVVPIGKSKNVFTKHLEKWLLGSQISIARSFKTKIPASLYMLQLVKSCGYWEREYSSPEVG
jgi:hypothetical protein